VESVFGDGGATRFVARLLEGGDEPAMPRVRHLAQDRRQVRDRYKKLGWGPSLTVRGGRCGYANQLPGLATTRQPLRPRGVTDVLETICTNVSGLDTSDAGRRGKELNLRPLPCVRSTLPLSYPPNEGMSNKSAGQRAICWTRCLGPKAQSHVMPERLPPTSDLCSERTRIDQQAIAGLRRQL
jgi:hypothetical protein